MRRCIYRLLFTVYWSSTLFRDRMFAFLSVIFSRLPTSDLAPSFVHSLSIPFVCCAGHRLPIINHRLFRLLSDFDIRNSVFDIRYSFCCFWFVLVLLLVLVLSCLSGSSGSLKVQEFRSEDRVHAPLYLPFTVYCSPFTGLPLSSGTVRSFMSDHRLPFIRIC
jgi:hypothetical protein